MSSILLMIVGGIVLLFVLTIALIYWFVRLAISAQLADLEEEISALRKQNNLLKKIAKATNQELKQSNKNHQELISALRGKL